MYMMARYNQPSALNSIALGNAGNCLLQCAVCCDTTRLPVFHMRAGARAQGWGWGVKVPGWQCAVLLEAHVLAIPTDACVVTAIVLVVGIWQRWRQVLQSCNFCD